MEIVYFKLMTEADREAASVQSGAAGAPRGGAGRNVKLMREEEPALIRLGIKGCGGELRALPPLAQGSLLLLAARSRLRRSLRSHSQGFDMQTPLAHWLPGAL